MPDARREQVRANAAYLREVRPLDPDEISTYVEGEPHPAVVRTDLRSLATELDLVERSDGTFVPVEDGPLSPSFSGVEALPSRHDERLGDLLVDRYGAQWHAGESGDRLRERISRLKADYYRGAAVEYDADAALAYAVYHLPGYYATTQYVLHELGGDGRLPTRLRVLDVGAGVGGPALGLADYLPDDALLEYEAVEPSDAADVLTAMLEGAGRNVYPTVHRETAEAFDPAGEYDLVLFSNVLSELDAPADVAARYLDSVADDGTLAMVAPADRETSIGLREVERTLVDDRELGSVYAPTVRLWPGERPTDRGWSFRQEPDIEVPGVQRRLADGATDPSAVTNTSLKFSYSLVRPDGARRHDLSLSRSKWASLGGLEEQVTKRVDLVVAKLSGDLSEGPNALYKVSDGSESVDVYASHVNRTGLNEALALAPYGGLLSVENGLVLWNDDEGAYNVVVDEDAVVDPIG